jgi:5-methylcytosine-specific restriction endonuclease McrA
MSVPYWQQRQQQKINGTKTKKAKADSKKAQKDELTKWFELQLSMCPRNCENCNTGLSQFLFPNPRTLVAHIIPKREDYGFPEVATHPYNRMFLCPDCHHKWDDGNAQDREKMAVYRIALQRFTIFKHELPHNRLSKALNYLSL